MDIICFGQQNWDYCWTGKQQLMSRLASRGHRILYVDPTWAGSGGPARDAAGLRHEGPGDLHVLTHGYRPLLRWRGNRWWWPRAIRRTAAELGLSSPVAVALRPPALRLMETLDMGGRVYYAVDEMTAFGDRSPAQKRAVRAEEEAMLRHVDVAVGVSRRLTDRFATVHSRSRFLPNGADVDHFSPASLASAALHEGIPRPFAGTTLVFVGQVDERLDQALLRSLVEALPDCRVVLAGRVKQGTDVEALRSDPRIHLLGYVPYERLPGVLRAADVCLVPYVVNELTRSCNPLKVFEYLATGKPVVATDLDGLEWCDDVIHVAEDRDDFVAGVQQTLDEASHAASSQAREERLRRARANGWEARVDALESVLEEAREIEDERRRRRSAPPDPRFAGGGLGPAGEIAHSLSRATGHVLSAGRSGASVARGRRPGVRRILVARRTRLGDLVVALPMLNALRALYPRAHIDLAVQPGAEEMARRIVEPGSDGPVDGVVVLDFLSSPSRRDQLRGASRLVARRYDLLVTGAGYSMLPEATLCGAPRWVSLDDGHPLQQRATHRVRLDPFRHEAANHLALAEALGGTALGPSRCPRVASPGAEVRRSVRMKLGVAGDTDLVVVHPGAQKPSRRWPAERYGRVIATLLASKPELQVVITAGAGEEDLTERVRSAVPNPERSRCVSAAGRTDLGELVALLSEAALVICGDTGVLHLARAVGSPLLALLGPENEDRWGPHPGGPGPAVSLRHEVPCAPCKRWDCEPHYCLESLQADEVAAAAASLLGDGGPGRAGEAHATASAPGPVTYEAWAQGYGDEIPHTAAATLHGLHRSTRRETWRSLSGRAPEPPDVDILLPAGVAVGPESGSPFDYPPGRLSARTELEDPGFAVAVVPDIAQWARGRLSAEVAALVRRPDLGAAGMGGIARNAGDPLPGNVAAMGVTFRGSVVRELMQERRASEIVGPAEYRVLRLAWRALGGETMSAATEGHE